MSNNFVTEMDSTAILGIEACQRLGVVEGFDSVGTEIPVEYVDAFKGFGCRPGECKIKVDPSVPPVEHAPGKVPVAQGLCVKLRNLTTSILFLKLCIGYQ